MCHRKKVNKSNKMKTIQSIQSLNLLISIKFSAFFKKMEHFSKGRGSPVDAGGGEAGEVDPQAGR
jgi:hypothetical protein